jgi:hypothetical protein
VVNLNLNASPLMWATPSNCGELLKRQTPSLGPRKRKVARLIASGTVTALTMKQWTIRSQVPLLTRASLGWLGKVQRLDGGGLLYERSRLGKLSRIEWLKV